MSVATFWYCVALCVVAMFTADVFLAMLFYGWWKETDE